MKKMSKGMLMTALICGAVYLGGSPVYASELQEFSLDEYVVTAARTETKLVDTPANISVVDAQTIEERHYQDVSEVLKDVPGANVMDIGIGATEKVVRLNGDDRVLVLVDGRRVTNDTGSTSSGRNSMDMNLLPNVDLIERIEVLKGAGGALYGSEAVGGVINIITKKSDLNYGKLSYAIGSNDTRDMSAVYSFSEGKTGVVVSAAKDKQGYYKFKDYATNKTKRWGKSSEYENEKVSLKLDQEITNNTNLSIGYDYSKYKGTNTFDYTGIYASKLDKTSNNMYVKYDWVLNNKDNGYIQFYHNELEYNNYAAGNDGNFKEKTNGLDFQQEISLNEDNILVVGTSWRKSDVKVSGVCNYDESVDNIALFVNDTWEFAPTWTLNTGVRYDNHSEAGDETTISTGLNKKFNDNSHIYFNWGQVFRAPSTDDLFYYSESTYEDWQNPGQYYTSYSYGNKDLKPETGDSWTLGYVTDITDNTSVGINYFESDLKDAIRWNMVGNDSYVENIDNQKKKGMELTVKHQLNKNFELEASYTYLKVNNDKGDGYTRDANVIPNLFRLGARYNYGKWNANAFIKYGTGAFTSIYDNSGSATKAYNDSKYFTLDLAITYKANKDLNLYVKGLNLLNESYAEHGGVNITTGSYKYPAQSRRFIVGAEYKF